MCARLCFVSLLKRGLFGDHPMPSRRKLRIASHEPPVEGNILGCVSVDCTNALQYIEEKRRETGVKITITHIAIKAVAEVNWCLHPYLCVWWKGRRAT